MAAIYSCFFVFSLLHYSYISVGNSEPVSTRNMQHNYWKLILTTSSSKTDSTIIKSESIAKKHHQNFEDMDSNSPESDLTVIMLWLISYM